MKLVTFQSRAAADELERRGFLIARRMNRHDDLKYGRPYAWIVERMPVPPEFPDQTPLWAWVKYKRLACPRRVRRKEPMASETVKITFQKLESDLLLTDFAAWSFVLNGQYLPSSRRDWRRMKEKQARLGVSDDELKALMRPDKFPSHRTDAPFLALCAEIRKSWRRCVTDRAAIVQACFWRLDAKDVVKIERFDDPWYNYGTVNYVRANGSRPDWIADYIKGLPQ